MRDFKRSSKPEEVKSEKGMRNGDSFGSEGVAKRQRDDEAGGV